MNTVVIHISPSANYIFAAHFSTAFKTDKKHITIRMMINPCLSERFILKYKILAEHLQ